MPDEMSGSTGSATFSIRIRMSVAIAVLLAGPLASAAPQVRPRPVEPHLPRIEIERGTSRVPRAQSRDLELLRPIARQEGVLCTKPGIFGFEAEAREAKHTLPSNVTSDLSQATYFITLNSVDRSFYVHSNYREPGGEYVTKLANGDPMSLDLVVKNFARSPDFDSGPVLENAHFILTPEVFRSPDLVETLKLKSAKHVEVARDGAVEPVLRLETEGLRERWVTSAGEGLYLDAGARADLIDGLRRQVLKASDVALLSLSQNSATREKVATVAGASTFEGTSTDTLTRQLQSLKGKTLFVLGHMESADYVTRDAAGKEVFRINVDSLTNLAAACCDIQVFALGCHSADHTSSGVLGTFNTLTALDHYSHALNASTMLQFLQALAGGDPSLSLVVDPEIANHAGQVNAGVIALSRPAGAPGILRGRQVARIKFTPRQAPPDIPAPGDADNGTQTTADAGDTNSDWAGCGCVALVVAGAAFALVALAMRKRRNRNGG